MVARRCPVAAHTERIRAAGGKRTSVDLTPAALVDLQALRSTGNHRSTSETICAALALAAAQPKDHPMTLDEALRQARIAVDAPHPAGYISDSTMISRAALRQVLDELAATSRGMAITPAKVTLSDYVTLRDQFAMHAPLEPMAFTNDLDSVGLKARVALALAYADAMMAARGAK